MLLTRYLYIIYEDQESQRKSLTLLLRIIILSSTKYSNTVIATSFNVSILLCDIAGQNVPPASSREQYVSMKQTVETANGGKTFMHNLSIRGARITQQMRVVFPCNI